MAFKKEKYGKILVPMMTPFKEDQSIDFEAAKNLMDYLISSGNADTIIIGGTTGEFHTMNTEERCELMKEMMKHAAGRIPVIAGVGAQSTKETIILAREAEKLEYEVIMIVAPYYSKPNQAELLYHYQQVAQSVNVDIMIYNIPIFTGVNVDPETLQKLAKIPNIVAVKEEAELNPKQMTAFMNATPEDFIVYNGDDTMILEAYAQGGTKRIGGVISGASHLIGKEIRVMIETFLDGKIQESAEMQRKYFPLFRIMGQGNRTNPVCLWKETMRMVGVDAGLPRRPLSPGTPDQIANIRKLLLQMNLIKD